MANADSIDPGPEDFAAAEATVGPLLAENGSPAGARIRYEAAQAHKLIRRLKDIAQAVRDMGQGSAASCNSAPRQKKAKRDIRAARPSRKKVERRLGR
jgi:hypothetical protein